MEPEDASTELRLLQEKAFGRDGDATALELRRLAELQRIESTDESAESTDPDELLASSVMEPAETPLTPLRADAPPAPRGVQSRIVFAAVGGALLVGLLAGSWVGALNASRQPASKLPPEFAGYDAESVTYFGSIESVEVWTAQTSDGTERCLLTLGDSSSWMSTSTCLPVESAEDLMTAHSGPTTETARRYTIVRQNDGTSVLVYDTVDVETLKSSG